MFAVAEEEVRANGDVSASEADAPEGGAEDDDAWERVGPRNKSVVTRTVSPTLTIKSQPDSQFLTEA